MGSLKTVLQVTHCSSSRVALLSNAVLLGNAVRAICICSRGALSAAVSDDAGGFLQRPIAKARSRPAFAKGSGKCLLGTALAAVMALGDCYSRAGRGGSRGARSGAVQRRSGREIGQRGCCETGRSELLGSATSQGG